MFNTIARLKNEYDNNVSSLNIEFDKVRDTHNSLVTALRTEISNLKKELKLLDS